MLWRQWQGLFDSTAQTVLSFGVTRVAIPVGHPGSVIKEASPAKNYGGVTG